MERNNNDRPQRPRPMRRDDEHRPPRRDRDDDRGGREFRKPHFEDRPRREHPRRRVPKHKTQMFTSKEELVKFVNVKGEEGHHIDVYKIDEDLYKVVVMEKPKQEDLD